MSYHSAPPRLRALPAQRLRHPDLASALLLAALTLVAAAPLIWRGTMIGQDTSTFFYPWFSYLGEHLRAGDLPLWSPHQFSGAPFLADPQSGWMYLPAMVLFSILPLSLAAKGYILFHLLLGGVSTYVLGRVLRMSVPGALVAAVAYELAGLPYVNATCCPNHTGVPAWLPLTLLGAELAIRRPRLPDSAPWWGLSGLALSQTLASWLGQGSYYALLALGVYVT